MKNSVNDYQLMALLEHAFDHLVEASQGLLDTFDPDRHPCWQFPASQPVQEWLKLALTDYWYQQGQDGRTTRPYIGLVAADQALIERAHEVNRCKQALAALIAQVRVQTPEAIADIKATLPFRHPLLHQHMKGAGLARLHLKQCWRQVPIAPAPVARIRMAWYSSGRSIRKVSVADAEKMLLQLDQNAAHVQLQRQRLAALQSNEPLAQVQAQAPLMRANLFYREPLEDGRTRQAMNVALPLFVPAAEQDGRCRLPHYNQPPAEPPEERTRTRRRDSAIEDEAWLPSLRIHRYRQT